MSTHNICYHAENMKNIMWQPPLLCCYDPHREYVNWQKNITAQPLYSSEFQFRFILLVFLQKQW